MQVFFRPAAAEDAAVISSLRKTIWGTTYRGIYPDAEIDRYDTERHLRRDLARISDPSYRVYLILDGDRPIGYLYFQHRGGVHIQSLYVLREYQRRGIGRKAFEIVRAYCRAQGLTGFTCNCNAHNRNARAFYEHFGGIVVAEDVGHANLQEDQITYAFSLDKEFCDKEFRNTAGIPKRGAAFLAERGGKQQ